MFIFKLSLCWWYSSVLSSSLRLTFIISIVSFALEYSFDQFCDELRSFLFSCFSSSISIMIFLPPSLSLCIAFPVILFLWYARIRWFLASLNGNYWYWEKMVSFRWCSAVWSYQKAIEGNHLLFHISSTQVIYAQRLSSHLDGLISYETLFSRKKSNIHGSKVSLIPLKSFWWNCSSINRPSPTKYSNLDYLQLWMVFSHYLCTRLSLITW